jgi:hypothetical protein
VNDSALLRTFEPILRCTHGELFFPADAERYVAECDLWVGRSQNEATLVVPYGSLSARQLPTVEAAPGERLFLRLVQRPYSGVELARWWARPDRPTFHAAGRLARVGLFARIVDAAFNISLFVRGSVPGGTTAAAWEKYQRVAELDRQPVYYGRVLRRDGWIVLHYLFFYFMNDWRSTFGGANDHEADWEQMFVFLEDRADAPIPVWCAAATHDEYGDDLRRRWDDPQLEREGSHPVLYVGAGSHATYFTRGEYITAAPLPGMSRLDGLLDALRAFWRDTLRQSDPGDLAARLRGWFSIPFIDYARGDGIRIGPGQSMEWAPRPIGDEVAWVRGYRGLFGLDTYDRFAGERAPAGPKFTRDGEVRRAWHDPLGWAGLAKVAPPSRTPDLIRERTAGLRADLESMRDRERGLAVDLPRRHLEAEALRAAATPIRLRQEREAEVLRAEEELDLLRIAIADAEMRIEAAERELGRVERGDLGDPRVHLSHRRDPVPPEVVRYGVLVELWSAVGFGLLLLAVISLFLFTPVPVWAAVLLSLALYVVVEAAFRRRIVVLLLRLTLALAIVAALILVWEFAGALLVLALVALALLTITDNVRELRRR